MIFLFRSFLCNRHHRAHARRWTSLLGVLLLIAIRPLAGQTEAPSELQPSVETAIAQPTDVQGQSGYTGPAVLSRSSQPGIGQGAKIAVQPFLYLNQVYDTGATAWSGNAAGSSGSVGEQIGFGLRGTHQWKRITLNIEYEGNWSHYSQLTAYNGTNQFLRVTAVTPLRRHLSLAVSQTVGTVIQDLGSLLVQPAAPGMSSPLPANEPFDNRARFLQSQGTVTYQKSRRLSFTATMDGSVVRRESAPLVGTNVFSIGGDVGYLLTRHATVGLDYNITQFGYTTFGSAHLHTVSGNFSWRLRKTVELGLRLGISRGDVFGLVGVPLDPYIAALLGSATGVQTSYQVFSTPAVRCHVTKHWHRASADIGYQRGISPGNGLVLTSNTESIDAGLQYSYSRGWGLSIQGGWTSMQALTGLAATSYTGYLAGVSVTRSIRPSMQMVARFDARPFSYVGPAIPARNFYRASIGFMFTPRELPVVLK